MLQDPDTSDGLQAHYHRMQETVRTISPIGDTDWTLFQAGLQYQLIKKGNYFIEEGKTCNYIGFVLAGIMRAYYLVDGEEINCDFFFEGQWPKAYHSFLTGKPSRIWVQAMQDTQLFRIGFGHLQRMFTESRDWERFGRVVTERLFIASQERSDTLLLDKPETRYKNLSLNRPEILERIPLYHIASYLGIRQPSLSRIRSRLSKK